MADSEEVFVEKLRKMKRMTEDASLTEEEVALWAEKLAKLLAERGLSMMDIEEKDRKDHVVDELVQMMYSDPWRVALFSAVAKLYFCYMFRDQWYDERAGRYRACVTLVGRPHNVAVARETYDYLEKTTLRLAVEYSKSEDVENDIRLGGTTTRAARLGFERGCGERLGNRILILYHQQSTKAPVSGEKNTLPMLYRSEIQLASDHAHQKFSLKKTKRRSSDINDHGDAGASAAEGVGLSPQVSGSKTGGNLLR